MADLNSDILIKIQEGIRHNFNIIAESAYVKMVWKMPKLSATAFLENLYALCDSGWDDRLPPTGNTTGMAFEKDEHGNYDTTSGIIGMMGAMFGDNDRDETVMIRRSFLQCNRLDELRQDGYAGMHRSFTFPRERKDES